MKILIWNEDSIEEQRGKVKRAYPQGMQTALGEIFDKTQHQVVIASLAEAEDGLSAERLADTDVLLYWAHCKHEKVSDQTVQRIYEAAQRGMGVIFLHSAHFSKPFKKIMGTSGSLKWREDNKHERLYNVYPTHPIATGVGERIFIPKEEMYTEYFDIPTPDDIVFLGWYPGGELFRSGFTYHCGEGRVFYFQPGHESFPIYYQKEIKRIIYNAVMWAGKQEIPSEKTFVTDKCDWTAPLQSNITLYLKRK